MPKDKKGFIVYSDWYDVLFNFSNEELGVLLRAMFRYNDDKSLPCMNDSLKIAFSFMKQTFDRDKQKYINRCEKNRKAATIRWSQTHNQDDDYTD